LPSLPSLYGRTPAPRNCSDAAEGATANTKGLPTFQCVPDLIEDGAVELPGTFRLLIKRLLEHLKLLQRQVDEIEAQIKLWHRSERELIDA
jgi:hypothetical protein